MRAGRLLLMISVLAVAATVPCAGAAHAAGPSAPQIVTSVGSVGPSGSALSIGQYPAHVDVKGSTLLVGDGQHGVVRSIDNAGNEVPVIGVGGNGSSGDGGLPTAAEISSSPDMTSDTGGDSIILEPTTGRIALVAASTGTIYGVAMTAGNIYTVAGDGLQGTPGEGTPALSTHMNYPSAVVADSASNIIYADSSNNRVRIIANVTGSAYGVAMTAGNAYTIAGNGVNNFSGDGGPGTAASVYNPQGVAIDTNGNVVISDALNNRIRVLAATSGTFYGQAMAAGDIYTIAGTGSDGSSGDGGPGTAAKLSQPKDLTVDANGNVVVVDYSNARIRVIAATTGTYYGTAMTAGNIYLLAGTIGGGFGGDGGSATSAKLNFPSDVAVDASGNLVIADEFNRRVRVVAEAPGTFYGVSMAAGDIYTVAGNGHAGDSGDGGPATAAQIDSPGGVVVDAFGNTLLTDSGNNRIRVEAASNGTFYGIAMTSGDIYTIAGTGVYGYSGDGGPATSAKVGQPAGLAVDHDGNVVVADTFNNAVRVIATTSGSFYGIAMTAGDIYRIAGFGSGLGDGGPALNAGLMSPNGVAIDPSGNVVIDDTFDDRIRVVAEGTGTYYGMAMTAGDIYTVAGGGSGNPLHGAPGPSIQMFPFGVATDPLGNILIADSGYGRLVVLAGSTATFYGTPMTVGYAYTVAGNESGMLGDGGPAASADVQPQGVAVDPNGNVLLAEPVRSRVRLVATTTGMFYGVSMVAGDIYTVAGNGSAGFVGDGGAATDAQLDKAAGVTSDPTGNILVADGNNHRIRRVLSTAATYVTRTATLIGTGQALTISWGDIGAPTPTDWIGLYPVGSALDRNFVGWRYTTGSASGSVTLMIPAGIPSGTTYELRLFSQNGFTRLATSPPFTVQASAVSASPTTIGTGQTLTINWSNVLNPSSTDWVGLYPSIGATNGSFLAWRYTGNAPSGTVPLVVPSGIPSGTTYELRLFRNNGFNRMARTTAFTVQAATVAESPNPVTHGTALTATWGNVTAPTSTDWVGLFVPGSANSKFLAWTYTSGSGSGSVSLTVPGSVAAGSYELRLFTHNGFGRMANSASFQVQ